MLKKEKNAASVFQIGSALQIRTALLACFVAVQFILIRYYNFTSIEKFLDYDSSLAIRHAVEMWRHHTIFLKDFIYTTSMEIDCASFFAAPIYILTGNLSFSIGVSHFILDTVLMVCIYCLLYNLQVGIDYRLLGILLVFTPYAYGPLRYDNMLFLSVGQYEFRVLTTVSILMVLAYKNKEWGKLHFAGWLLSLFSLFWTILSTGNYMCMVLIAPIMLYRIFTGIKEQHFEKRNVMVLASWIIVAVMAVILLKAMPVDLHRTNMEMVVYSEFADNFFDMVKGVFHLFNGMTGSKVEVLSVDGICMIVRFLFTLAMLAIPVIVLKNKLIGKENGIDFAGHVVMIAAVNVFILTVADVKYGGASFPSRYHMVWGISWILLGVLCIARYMETENNNWLKQGIWIVVVCGLVIMNGSGIYKLSGISEEEYTKRQYFLQQAAALEVDNIIVFDDLTTAHALNALDINKNVRGIFIAEDGTYAVDTWGNFADPNFNPHHLFLVKKGKVKKLSAEIMEHYRLVNEYDKWNIYVTDGYQW